MMAGNENANAANGDRLKAFKNKGRGDNEVHF